MKRLTLLLTVLGLIAGYPVFGQNGSSTCLHQWAPQSKVFQRGYQKQMVRGFQCAFCARFLTSLPSQRSRYRIASTTSWVSDPRNRNNVIIERFIRYYLTKPKGELTKADLKKVTNLSLSYYKLTDVKGLEKLTRVTWLGLARNKLTDVTVLEKLTQLRWLVLDVNQLTSVKGLEKLTRVTWLGLARNKLTDVKGLEKLTQLTHLHLGYNQLTSVKDLEKLTKLEQLWLDGNLYLTKAQIAELQKAMPKCKIFSNPTK